MARQSKGDKKLKEIVDMTHKKIEQYEAVNKEKLAEVEHNNDMILILKEQLESIEDTCKGVDGEKKQSLSKD